MIPTPNQITDVLAFARREFLWCHSLLSSKGVPALAHGEPISLSQRLGLYMQQQEKL